MALAEREWIAADELLDSGDERQVDTAGHLASPWSFLELLELERPAWQAQAACRGADPALFFPERGESSAPAQAICADCPVADECRDYAVDGEGEWPGVWGGTSKRQRRRLRRERPAEPPATTAQLIDAQEAAQRLGIDRSSLWRWVKLGRIRPVSRRRNGAMLFDAAAVARLGG